VSAPVNSVKNQGGHRIEPINLPIASIVRF